MILGAAGRLPAQHFFGTIRAAPAVFVFRDCIEDIKVNAVRCTDALVDHLDAVGDSEPIETNLVFFDIAGTGVAAATVHARLEAESINVGQSAATRLRICTHLDVRREQVETAAHAFVNIVNDLR